MENSVLLWSTLTGFSSGLLYGLIFMVQDLFIPYEKTSLSKIKKQKFISFFSMATFRIVLAALLWHYVLRSKSLNIILVLISFLVGFWAVVIKKKVLDE
jgi:predicted neutral ceramidase superfamily lipid hydrolase